MKINPFILFILTPAFLVACGGVKAPDSDDCLHLTREFLSFLVNKDYSRAVSMYNSIMKSTLPKNKLAEAWEGILDKTGGYEDEIAHYEKQDGQFTIVVITCRFMYTPLDMKVVFSPRKEITGLWFLPAYSAYNAYTYPEYVFPDLFTEEEVVFGEPGWKLPGTLTLPKEGRPGPVVLLVHGSGPQDRDETIGPNKPFKDIAGGLASNGIAVLRYEKRTKRYPSKFAGQLKNFTVAEETIDDACAAIVYLKTRREINRDLIFILGHSLGGMLIPRMALQNPGTAVCAGFIIAAGPTRPLEDLLEEQTEYIIGIDGNITEKEKQEFDELKEKIAVLKTGKLTPSTPAGELPLNIPPSYWLDLQGYMPHVLAAEMNRPLLILQGGRDYQVTKKDFLGWEKTLAGRKNVTLAFYNNLNHLLIPGQDPSTPSEYLQKGHVEKKVIDDIAVWIKNHPH